MRDKRESLKMLCEDKQRRVKEAHCIGWHSRTEIPKG